MRQLFISDDGRPYAEPLLAIVALLLDIFFGKTQFTTFFGWWLFMIVATNIPGRAYAASLMHFRKLDAYAEIYPRMVASIRSHNTFMFLTCYAVFLDYWWRWL